MCPQGLPSLVPRSFLLPYCPRQAPVGTHIVSQLKRWKYEGGLLRCFKDSTIPLQGPTLDAKLATMVYQINLHCRAHPDSGDCCNVLQSGPTRSLIAKFPLPL